MQNPESFEVTEYDPEDLPVAEQLSVMKQIMEDRKFDPEIRRLPTENFVLTLQGDQMRLAYHTYEMFLSTPDRMRDVEKNAEKCLGEGLKYLKKEFRKRTKKALSVKEQKDLRSYSVQKVSLNERYYFISWRVFKIDLAVR
jgi:hypothetical protein